MSATRTPHEAATSPPIDKQPLVAGAIAADVGAEALSFNIGSANEVAWPFAQTGWFTNLPRAALSNRNFTDVLLKFLPLAYVDVEYNQSLVGIEIMMLANANRSLG